MTLAMGRSPTLEWSIRGRVLKRGDFSASLPFICFHYPCVRFDNVFDGSGRF